MVLKKWAVYVEDQENKWSDREGDQKQHHGTSRTACSLCCPGVTRTYALQELKTATVDFKFRIGVGATSFMYLAELRDGRFGAVKRVMEERGGSRKMFLDEVSVLLRISHPNLVGLLGFCLDKGEQLLLQEYIPNKSLFDKMHTYHGQFSGMLTWSNRLNIALDIARALEYLHSQADPPIIHRDVKSSNILLVDNNHAKLADFGLCKLGYGTEHGSQTPTSLKSTQGSLTLVEWTEECRKSNDIEALARMLDPKLNGDANLGQLLSLISVANSALLENLEGRPDMSQIVDVILSSIEPQLHLELLV
ncbi:hypothetical protein SO802_034571 [Lithocarpus litseifolius]|uniref:non-specific serine/threonine protein kinase n=1 Tax=Lithocarpus litseifolius TaxID=425828 RepID=A0AAW2BIE2_9ROSI